MAGTKAGGALCAETNKKKYGKDYYQRIGAMGGKNGHTGGFAAGEEGRARARKYGAIGGSISRRPKRSKVKVYDAGESEREAAETY
jgi:uncharacterized protein